MNCEWEDIGCWIGTTELLRLDMDGRIRNTEYELLDGANPWVWNVVYAKIG